MDDGNGWSVDDPLSFDNTKKASFGLNGKSMPIPVETSQSLYTRNTLAFSVNRRPGTVNNSLQAQRSRTSGGDSMLTVTKPMVNKVNTIEKVKIKPAGFSCSTYEGNEVAKRGIIPSRTSNLSFTEIDKVTELKNVPSGSKSTGVMRSNDSHVDVSRRSTGTREALKAVYSNDNNEKKRPLPQNETYETLQSFYNKSEKKSTVNSQTEQNMGNHRRQAKGWNDEVYDALAQNNTQSTRSYGSNNRNSRNNGSTSNKKAKSNEVIDLLDSEDEKDNDVNELVIISDGNTRNTSVIQNLHTKPMSQINATHVYFGVLSFYNGINDSIVRVFRDRISIDLVETNTSKDNEDETAGDELPLQMNKLHSLSEVIPRRFVEKITFGLIEPKETPSVNSISGGRRSTNKDNTNKDYKSTGIITNNKSPEAFVCIRLTPDCDELLTLQCVRIGTGCVLDPSAPGGERLKTYPSKYILIIGTEQSVMNIWDALKHNDVWKHVVPNRPNQAQVVPAKLPSFPETSPLLQAHISRANFPRKSILNRVIEDREKVSALRTSGRRKRNNNSATYLIDSEYCDPEDSKVHLVYPVELESTDAITIHKGDLRRLEPGVYLNDNLIDLRIKHLLNNLCEEKRRKVHAFSCLFYSKLTEEKDKASHTLVSRWTKNLDLFNLDFIFIPINLSLHWSLCVVVRPGEIIKRIDKYIKSIGKQNTSAASSPVVESVENTLNKTEESSDLVIDDDGVSSSPSTSNKENELTISANQDQNTPLPAVTTNQNSAIDIPTDDVAENNTNTDHLMSIINEWEEDKNTVSMTKHFNSGKKKVPVVEKLYTTTTTATSSQDKQEDTHATTVAEGEEAKQDQDQCCLVFLDSLNMHNFRTIGRHITNYLFHEWETRYKDKMMASAAECKLESPPSSSSPVDNAMHTEAEDEVEKYPPDTANTTDIGGDNSAEVPTEMVTDTINNGNNNEGPETPTKAITTDKPLTKKQLTALKKARFERGYFDTYDSGDARKFFDIGFAARRLVVPTQNNGYDCGVYVIKYVQLILEQWPTSRAVDIDKNNLGINRNSFSGEDVVQERVYMQQLLKDLHTQYVELRKEAGMSEADMCKEQLSTAESQSSSVVCVEKTTTTSSAHEASHPNVGEDTEEVDETPTAARINVDMDVEVQDDSGDNTSETDDENVVVEREGGDGDDESDTMAMSTTKDELTRSLDADFKRVNRYSSLMTRHVGGKSISDESSSDEDSDSREVDDVNEDVVVVNNGDINHDKLVESSPADRRKARQQNKNLSNLEDNINGTGGDSGSFSQESAVSTAADQIEEIFSSPKKSPSHLQQPQHQHHSGNSTGSKSGKSGKRHAIEGASTGGSGDDIVNLNAVIDDALNEKTPNEPERKKRKRQKKNKNQLFQRPFSFDNREPTSSNDTTAISLEINDDDEYTYELGVSKNRMQIRPV